MKDIEKRQREILITAKEKQLLDEQNLQKWHGKISRNVEILDRDFDFTRKRVLDVGSYYGSTLLYWSKGSVGLEVQKECQQFLSAFNYLTVSVNVEDALRVGHSFEAVYSNNLIEHLVAPHLFLSRIYSALEPGGLLALGHPVMPIYPVNHLWAALGRRGVLAEEHINFFSALGIEYCLERAGFRVIKQYSKPFDRLGVHRIAYLNRLLGAFSVHVLTVARKVEGYQYPKKRAAMFDPSWGESLRVFRDSVSDQEAVVSNG